MALPSGATLTSASCVRAWLDYPFKSRGDSATKVYNHAMQVKALNYVPLADNDTMTAATQKPTNSPFPDDANAFWVGDSPVEPMDGGMIGFTRTFANIPADRTEGAGLYSFTFPNNSNTTQVSTFTQSGVSLATVSGRPECSFTANATNSLLLGIGDKFTLEKNNSRNFFKATPFGGSFISSGFPARLIVFSKIPNGSSFDIKAHVEGHDGFISSSWVYTTFTDFAIERITLEGRSSPTAINSPSTLSYKYIITDDITTEKLGEKYKIIQASNGSIDPVITDTISATTTPSLDIYNGMVYRGVYISAEADVPFRWHGNIWGIISRRVVVQ